MNFVHVRGHINETLINGRLDEGRLDLFPRSPTHVDAEELFQLGVDDEQVFLLSAVRLLRLVLRGCRTHLLRRRHLLLHWGRLLELALRLLLLVDLLLRQLLLELSRLLLGELGDLLGLLGRGVLGLLLLLLSLLPIHLIHSIVLLLMVELWGSSRILLLDLLRLLLVLRLSLRLRLRLRLLEATLLDDWLLHLLLGRRLLGRSSSLLLLLGLVLVILIGLLVVWSHVGRRGLVGVALVACLLLSHVEGVALKVTSLRCWGELALVLLFVIVHRL